MKANLENTHSCLTDKRCAIFDMFILNFIYFLFNIHVSNIDMVSIYITGPSKGYKQNISWQSSKILLEAHLCQLSNSWLQGRRP
jgi:hypothetical protein